MEVAVGAGGAGVAGVEEGEREENTEAVGRRLCYLGSACCNYTERCQLKILTDINTVPQQTKPPSAAITEVSSEREIEMRESERARRRQTYEEALIAVWMLC